MAKGAYLRYQVNQRLTMRQPTLLGETDRIANSGPCHSRIGTFADGPVRCWGET